MQIDKKLLIPLYKQVEQVLEEKLTSGKWAVGSQLPSEQELSDLFDVSKITVKRAIIELVNKGYLFRQRGKGTFVLGSVKEQDINSFISLTTETEEHPHELISFSIEDASCEIAEKLNVQNKSQIIKLKRIKVVDSEPMALEYTYLPYAKCSDLSPEDINNDLVYNILKNKFNIALGRAKLFINPYIVRNEKAKLLQVEPGTPVFEWERFTYTKQEEIIEYSKFYVRQDKETYYTEVHF
ncbi:GntR family transcriptional regulator [Bacillus canaveralius]|uniref:GntR family transcriptional regulator n=1 Tax=Bacillus canaveralius TaxID=1403243 RepID=A0A2N5GN26_9BACI|nr:GntR family transcriptional regulator [Bacillus canaveralius]PLR83569.1 GntR family transcriptional regulator [Bacillus canaveralius]PLS00755.1 GntR family transcriptional regulator [Bacillus canaveralius]RSK48643.1 GntR family transcriptional regulator [Bacillus canaveralius]